ncbi:MFS general substrate transporter [Apiospora saccharicola]
MYHCPSLVVAIVNSPSSVPAFSSPSSSSPLAFCAVFHPSRFPERGKPQDDQLRHRAPNTHAGGNDDALRGQGTIPVDPVRVNVNPDITIEAMDMAEYRRTVPRWKRFYKHSLTQMLLLSVQAFCGPAMSDAIAGLGGGGLATPQTSNIA